MTFSHNDQSADFSPSTIAAIATGVGGGVGIIRVSGPLSVKIGQALCHPWPSEIKSHQLYLTKFYQDISSSGLISKDPIDQGLLCLMKGPHSYTGEDVLELHGHGGQINLQRILQAVLQAGAVPAAPGEFTKRAFIAGKLDLTQAEAIASLVSAQSIQASRQAQRQLSGNLGREISEMRAILLRCLGTLEGSLDFPDNEEDEILISQSIGQLSSLQNTIAKLANSFTQGGKALHQGIEVALFGKTNAGKSSLINALCQQERVLVDEEPGTTRDFIEVKTQIGEVPVTLIDTAGQREAAGYLERQGLSLGRNRGKHADIVLLVIDGSVGIKDEDLEILKHIKEQTPVLFVINKMDRQDYKLPSAEEIENIKSLYNRTAIDSEMFSCSALCEFGLETLTQGILKRLAPHFSEETVIMSERQAHLLRQASYRLEGALGCLKNHAPLDITASELRLSVSALGELTGEEITESVIDQIFSQFCIGK